MNKSLRNIILISIGVISFLMHFNHFSKELMSIHVWRQTQTQSTIVNFYEEDMNILNPRRNERGATDGIFRMEFPLMQWLTACLYTVFGNHLILTRLFMFVIGLFSVLGIYRLLNVLFQNTTLSLMGAWAFNFSPAFYYYTINPLPDNLALCLAIWGLVLFFRWTHQQKLTLLAGSGLLLSLAALCKLPFIIYYIVPLTWFTTAAIRKNFKLSQFVAHTAFGLLPLAWYLNVISQWQGNPIVKGVLDNHEPISQLLDYLLHNLTSTLPELLLNYGSVPFFIAGFYFLFKRKAHHQPGFRPLLMLSIMAMVYYLFEANAIGKAHDYYLFPFYPLLFILVAYGAFHLYRAKSKYGKYLTLLFLLILPLSCYLRMQDRWNPESPGFNKDLLQYKTELRDAVPQQALVVAGNDESHFIWFYYLDKKGWGFDHDNLNPADLEVMIKDGAEYLYTDSETIGMHTGFSSYLDHLILQKGSVQVYKLRSPP